MWERLAGLAAESVRARTGLETRILGAAEMVKYQKRLPHHLKFKLFEAFPEAESILYFDADTIFLQDWQPQQFAGRAEIVCIRDRGEKKCVQEEAKKAGVATEAYFNSGLFIVNRTHHAALLARAEELSTQFVSGFHDQTYLNRARRELGIPAAYLPREYNWLDFDQLKDAGHVIVGHLAQPEKMSAGQLEATVRGWIVRGEGRSAPDVIPHLASSTPEMDRPIPAPTEEDAHRARLEAVAAASYPFPAERFAGRGIVICGGGFKYFPCVWVCVNMLRHLGCQLPIEVWHLGQSEMTAQMRGLLEPLGVRCVDGLEMRQTYPARRLHGWELKAYSLLHCTFREVLLLDADNVPVLDPTYLFDEPEYLATGAAFWPDFSRLGRERSIWKLTGVPPREEPEFESGQILLDKARCWHALQVAMHLNEYSDFYYRQVHGDKETFHLAWRKLNQDYAMPQRGIEALDATMCQHDFRGRRVFQHRNSDKWRLWCRNRRIHGFRHEHECRRFLAELAPRWQELPPGVQRYRGEGSTEMQRAAVERLVEVEWEYHRVGHDRREMSFGPDGLVQRGAAGCEVFWDVREREGRVQLGIYSEAGPTMFLEEDAQGVWRGRWLVFEKMPIELRRLRLGADAVRPVSAIKVTQEAPGNGVPGGEVFRPEVEAILINYRRPENVVRQIAALRAQTVACMITLCDVHPTPECALPESAVAAVDRHYRWEHNLGCFNRFVPALASAGPWVWYLDDDVVPGRRCLEFLLATARSRGCGAVGEFGRRFLFGEYRASDVARGPEPRRVDALVRSWLTPADYLAHVAATRWRHPELIYDGMGESDLLFALALREAGLPLWIVPANDDPETGLCAETLPEPFALSSRPDHASRRQAIVTRHFHRTYGTRWTETEVKQKNGKNGENPVLLGQI